MMEFSIDVNPAELPTAQQKGVRVVRVHGRMMPMFYEKSNVRKAHERLRRALSFFRPESPFECGITLSVRYMYPYPKGTPKCRLVDNVPMTQRPDVDNVQKMLQDVMGEVGFWKDDSQIWQLNLIKCRTTQHPRIEIQILT